MKLPVTFKDLIVEANRLDLYKKLIIQLNKDLLAAHIDLEINTCTLPITLKSLLQESVLYHIQNKFSAYVHLLYIVDVSEVKVRNLDTSDMLKLSEDVTFLILQRIWQKVWYKFNYS